MYLLFRQNLDSLFAAIIGFVAIQLFTQHGGIGVSPDSIHYISTANALNEGRTYLQFDNQPLIMFPFGFPSFLAITHWIFQIDLLKNMPIINGCMFAALIFLSGCMVEITNATKWLKWIILALILTSPTLLEIYFMMWSEALFALELMLFIWLCGNYFKQHSLKNLLILSAITAIAFDTRFAGISLVATGALLILLSHDMPWATKIKHGLLFGIISCSLVLINLSINYNLTNTLTGIRQKGVTGLSENIQYYGLVVASWLPFSKQTEGAAFYIGLLFIMLLFFIFIYRIYKRIEHNSFEKIAATFTLIYSIFMLVTATVSRYETMNSRLLSPFFIAFLFTLSFYIVSWIALIQKKTISRGLRICIVIISMLLVVQYVQKDIEVYNEVKQGGIGGYTEDDWKESELISYLKTRPVYFNGVVPIYSNASHAIYLYTKKAVNIVPERVHERKVAAFYAVPEMYLVWFNAEDNKELLNKAEISSHFNMKEVATFKDGIIFVTNHKK